MATRNTTKKVRKPYDKAYAEIQEGLWRVPTRALEPVPFEIMEPESEPSRGDDDQNMPGPGNFLWSDEAAHTAECALEEGLILIVAVTPEQAVPATAAIVQNLTSNVWCVYNKKAGCLLLWDHEPHNGKVATEKRHDNGTPEEKQN